MRVAGRPPFLPAVWLQLLLTAASFFGHGSSSCVDESFSSWEVSFERLRRLSRIAVVGHIAAYDVETAVSENGYRSLRVANGDHLVVYSTLSHAPSWTHVDLVVQAIRLRDAFNVTGELTRQPLVMATLCDYETPITAFDDSGFAVDSQRAGLVAMYENELVFVFRSYRSGIFFFSMADQGDILVAQLVRGTVQIIFDFGSLSPSWISGGRALDDGEWHEVRWLHQFDSVQLSIDGVLLNQTTPTGLYRKLDLHTQVHIAGRPSDDFSEGIESSFSGCLARLQLNSIDLLQFAPRDAAHTCTMPRPPSLTLDIDAQAVFPFSFLPFSFEFRLLPREGDLLNLKDAANISLVRVTVDEDGGLVLSSNATQYKQKANPPIKITDGSWHSLSLRIRGSRLEIDVDGITALWLEGQEVRKVASRLSSLLISSPGCYRSATVDLGSAKTTGTVIRGSCGLMDQCLPSPCENGGICEQKTLEEYVCKCPNGYSGTNCHTSDLPRSCEEWQYSKNIRGRITKGRNVTIDLDGGGPLLSFSVLCRTEKDDLGMDVMTTILDHDLKRAILVTGDLAPGAVRKTLSYGVNVQQLDRLVEGFDHCQQFMRFSCRGGARLMTHGQDRSPSSWYSTRSDKHGLQWGEAPPYSRMCSCAVNGTCLHNRMCNCDSGEDATDEGMNSYAQLLPVTGLFLGGTSKKSSVEAEIGSLVCRSRVSFEPVTFTDRNARLHGSRSFSSRTFDVLLQVKFTHPQMTIFAWESVDNLHWFQLHVQEGRVVAEVVNGGEVVQLSSSSPINNNRWHSIYWEADNRGMRLKVDGKSVVLNRTLILPSALHWSFGSRTSTGSSGFAGVVRNMYLCGEELALSILARKDAERGIVAGEDGYCRQGLCKNGGVCIDKYDGFSCDCSLTPFGGDDCTKEYGMWVPLGSSLQIPWQNPAHTSLCHRIAIQTRSSNISLVRSKALFADSTFNMSINTGGSLVVVVYDGVLFTHKEIFSRKNLSDDVVHDIAFCASEKEFNLTVDSEKAIHFEGNWTFFQNFNVWSFLDQNFTGCVSRLQVGASFPLKNAKAARLNHSGRIRFGTCPLQPEPKPQPPTPVDANSGIRIDAVSQHRHYIVSVTTIGALSLFLALALLTSVLICYMRSRPEGVYKTNEGTENCSPSRSEEPLVRGQSSLLTKEYFC